MDYTVFYKFGEEIGDKYRVSNPFLAIAQFKILVEEFYQNKSENSSEDKWLYLCNGSTICFCYDMRPDTDDRYRWRMKISPLTRESITPKFESPALLVAMFEKSGLNRGNLSYWKQIGRFTPGYDYIKFGSSPLYDVEAVKQLLAKEKDII